MISKILALLDLVVVGGGAILLVHTWQLRKKRLSLDARFREYDQAFKVAQKNHNVALMTSINDQCEAIVDEMKRL